MLPSKKEVIMRSRFSVVRGVVIAAIVAVGLAGAVVPAQAADTQITSAVPGAPTNLRIVLTPGN